MAEPTRASIVAHLEAHLGTLAQAWVNEAHPEMGVAMFTDPPWEDALVLATAGLSHHPLDMPSGAKVRHELVMPLAADEAEPGPATLSSLVGLLMFLSDGLIDMKRSPGRGQVILLPQDVAEALRFAAIYCSAPTFLEDDFALIRATDPPTVLIWTIPIQQAEANYIAAEGWNAFEDRLVDAEPDLFVPHRPAVVA